MAASRAFHNQSRGVAVPLVMLALVGIALLIKEFAAEGTLLFRQLHVIRHRPLAEDRALAQVSIQSRSPGKGSLICSSATGKAGRQSLELELCALGYDRTGATSQSATWILDNSSLIDLKQFAGAVVSCLSPSPQPRPASQFWLSGRWCRFSSYLSSSSVKFQGNLIVQQLALSSSSAEEPPGIFAIGGINIGSLQLSSSAVVLTLGDLEIDQLVVQQLSQPIDLLLVSLLGQVKLDSITAQPPNMLRVSVWSRKPSATPPGLVPARQQLEELESLLLWLDRK